MVLRVVAAVLAATGSLTLPSELLAGGEWQRSVAGADYAPELPPDNWPNNWPYHPPIKREWPDGPNKEFLKNLQRPDNWKNPSRWPNPNSLSCCDAGDTVKTKFKVEPVGNSQLGDYPEDRWYAWINGEWVLVPPDKIVPDHAPDGTPYLFMMAGTIQCFVRPRAGYEWPQGPGTLHQLRGGCHGELVMRRYWQPSAWRRRGSSSERGEQHNDRRDHPHACYRLRAVSGERVRRSRALDTQIVDRLPDDCGHE